MTDGELLGRVVVLTAAAAVIVAIGLWWVLRQRAPRPAPWIRPEPRTRRRRHRPGRRPRQASRPGGVGQCAKSSVGFPPASRHRHPDYRMTWCGTVGGQRMVDWLCGMSLAGELQGRYRNAPGRP